MRTTLNLDDALLARARVRAARERTTLTRLIEEGLALRLGLGPRARREGEPSPLPVFHGGTGMASDIDPRSNRSLLEAADEADLAEERLR